MDDTEATQLMLEALFEIRACVVEMHEAMFGGDADEEAPEEDA